MPPFSRPLHSMRRAEVCLLIDIAVHYTLWYCMAALTPVVVHYTKDLLCFSIRLLLRIFYTAWMP